MATCVKERTYEDGDWIVTEKITLVIGEDILTYFGKDFVYDSSKIFDTGWLATVDGDTQYRTFLADLSASCEPANTCLSDIPIGGPPVPVSP